MPIQKLNAPDENFELVREHAQSFHHEGVTRDESGNQHHHIPHKIYDPSLVNLAEGMDLREMQPSGWRYVFQDAQGEYHIAEVGINEELDEHKFRHINLGGHTNHFISIYQRLHDHPHVQNKDYEISILRVPSCYVMAIWIRGVDHDHDFFIPLNPVNPAFVGGETYRNHEFMEILIHLAQQIVGKDAGAAESSDNLTLIEGIGDKAAAILNESGFDTFEALAAATPTDLESVLKADSKFNFLDASTWPEQAQLAAANKWDELKKLQDELKGGKRK